MRAVDRIDHPDGGCVGVARAALLARKPSLGEKPRQAANDQPRMRGRPRDKILRALAVDAEKLTPGEMICGKPARLAHHRLGDAQAMVEFHRRKALIGRLIRRPFRRVPPAAR